MDVLYLSYTYEPSVRNPEALLEHYFPMHAWCAALVAAGVERVTTLQRFHHAASLRVDGVEYEFVSDGLAPRLRWWKRPRYFHAAIRDAAHRHADLVHFNGMIYPVHLRALRRVMPRRAAIVVQNHAERPPAGPRRHLFRWGLGAADGVLFAAEALAQAWRDAGAMPTALPSYEVMECPAHLPATDASDFGPGAYPGSPRFLWLGNLDANKDPLTVLAGFARIVADYPDACLLMAYRGDELLPAVRGAVEELGLGRRVHLLGKIPRSSLRGFLEAGDFLLQGSYREGSGLAVIEALACGVHPVVTDIPALAVITGGGSAGTLWRPGDVDDLVRAIREAVTRRQSRDEIRRFYARSWSHEAVGRAASAAYGAAIRARRSGGRRVGRGKQKSPLE